MPVHSSCSEPFWYPYDTETVTTSAKIRAAPKDESFVDVELIFAEPRDVRL